MLVRQCPKCPSSLVEIRSKGVMLWSCEGCHGVWIPQEVMASYLNDTKDVWMTFFAGGKETELECPDCRDAFLSTAELAETEVDGCLRCKGLFFDAGEMGSVISKLRGPSPRMSLAAEGAAWAGGDIILEAISAIFGSFWDV